ncbi:hypothetical protein TREMEDRAFT_35707, partial [Tremella mesenterica DSM 1558]|uniref:uncharacterized protein n=1 Tax=Tremella mesenterica (strain ATCC 24925 / CBS 8224 / DSM 1558 / NBRC 9311 / NRRL Y-6157 / RJB 2259-6 / UBC 559-6) TaxID=578456 RepID=UPI00032D3DB3
QSLPPHLLTKPHIYPSYPNPTKPPLVGPPKSLAKSLDPFFLSHSDPLDHTLNPHFSLSFIDRLGRILPRSRTGLTRRSQRRIGKMVRRARSMGLVSKFVNLPSVGGYGYEGGYMR